MLIENLKHITIWYYTPVESVKLMIQEHYDKPEYDGTLFILNTWFVYYGNVNFNDKKYRKIIYYHLEHTYNKHSIDKNEHLLLNNLNSAGVDEIWEMEYKSAFGNVAKSEHGLTVKYKPMRYTSLIKPITDIYATPKTSDFVFIGSMSEYRNHFFNEYCGKIWDTGIYNSLKIIVGEFNITNKIKEMNSSKYVLDIKSVDDMIGVNQVRIFELLCMGYTVCVNKMNINMFPGLIYEWDTIDDLYEIAKNGKYLHPTETYKEMTYTNEAYEKYVNNLIKQQS